MPVKGLVVRGAGFDGFTGIAVGGGGGGQDRQG